MKKISPQSAKHMILDMQRRNMSSTDIYERMYRLGFNAPEVDEIMESVPNASKQVSYNSPKAKNGDLAFENYGKNKIMYEQERFKPGLWLSIWLGLQLFLLVISVFTFFTLVVNPPASASSGDSLFFGGFLILGLIQISCVIGLWFGKELAYYGLIVIGVLGVVLSIFSGGSGFIGGIVYIVILVALVHPRRYELT